MPPGLTGTTALVAAFVLTHLGLGQPPLRDAVADRIGSVRFTVLYAVVAWGSLGALIYRYLVERADGPPGLGLGGIGWVHTAAIVLMVAGMVLMVAIVAPSGYLRSAAVVFGRHTRAPGGLERVTRHPFFVGLALLCIGHILVAPRLAGVIVFGGFGLLAVLGGPLQDRKLRARRGPPHEAYLAATSIVPFVAVLRGRQSLVAAELPWVFGLLGIPSAWIARRVHGTGLGPWLVMGVLVIAPLWFAVASAFRHHRARSS